MINVKPGQHTNAILSPLNWIKSNWYRVICIPIPKSEIVASLVIAFVWARCMKPIAVCQAKRLLDHISAKTVVYLSCALIKTKYFALLKISWLSLCGSQFVFVFCFFVKLFFPFSFFFFLNFVMELIKKTTTPLQCRLEIPFTMSCCGFVDSLVSRWPQREF